MTDLHTHILPGMDDGSRNVGESKRLIAMEQEQGVTDIVLTPHYYRWYEEPESFFIRRGASWDKLRGQIGGGGPAFHLGAEVAWFPSLAGFPALEKLCIGHSGQFLLELPFERWNSKLMDKLYGLTCSTGLTPVIAHVERYIGIQRKELIDELVDLGLPLQMNADSLLKMGQRGKCLKLLRRGRWYLASDCHRFDSRPPRMAEALQYLRGRAGDIEPLTD